MSKNWTYSSQLWFLMKLPQFFPWRNSVRIMGVHTAGSAVTNHISSEMARELIAIYPTVYHLWFLVCQRVLPQPHLHLLLHHLHHRIPYLMSTDTPKIQYPKEVEVRVKTYRELGLHPLHRPTETENTKKWRTRRSTKRSIAWLARPASGFQREFGPWK